MRSLSRSLLVAALVGAALFAGVSAGAGAAFADECAPGTVDVRDANGQARFTVEVVDTPEGREKGLMFREQMPRYSGMLFVYEYPQPVAFWMRNTLIPLDILFFDASGRLRTVHPDAKPLDETPIPGGQDIRFVLELNGGMAATLGIVPGAELRHPSLDQTIAAWPCAE